MKVFLSWSGERSKALAVELKKWLQLVLHYVEPWMSDRDIEAGERWAQSVAEELKDTDFGIICLTPGNLEAPWVLFEAGALAKSLEKSKVIPLLLELDFSDISGPLTQFQAKKAEKDGVLEVIQSIQKTATPELRVPEDRIDKLFTAVWPDLEKTIKEIAEKRTHKTKKRTQAEILEELVQSVRAMDVKLDFLSSSRPDDEMTNSLDNLLKRFYLNEKNLSSASNPSLNFLHYSTARNVIAHENKKKRDNEAFETVAEAILEAELGNPKLLFNAESAVKDLDYKFAASLKEIIGLAESVVRNESDEKLKQVIQDAILRLKVTYMDLVASQVKKGQLPRLEI